MYHAIEYVSYFDIRRDVKTLSTGVGRMSLVVRVQKVDIRKNLQGVFLVGF